MQVNHGPGILPGLPGGAPYVSAEAQREARERQLAGLRDRTWPDYIKAQQARKLGLPMP